MGLFDKMFGGSEDVPPPAPKPALVPGKNWLIVKQDSAKEQADHREAEIYSHFAAMFDNLPGVKSVTFDGRKMKVVIDDQGYGLLVQAVINVHEADLGAVNAQEQRLKTMAQQLRDRADALEKQPAITGRLNLKVTPDQIFKIKGGAA